MNVNETTISIYLSEEEVNKLETILHLNGCQQRTAGYNEAKKGEELNLSDAAYFEELTLKEVTQLLEEITAGNIKKLAFHLGTDVKTLEGYLRSK